LALSACGGLELPGDPGPCSNGPTGIDVSEFNGPIDWPAVADAGFRFAFAKASEGLTIADARFTENWAGMRASGLARGAYHYFHPRDDGADQADAFLSLVEGFEAGDLPPVLDWETLDDVTPQTALASAEAFLAEVENRSGRATMIYTYRAFWDSIRDPSELGSNMLWLASDRLSCPVAPPPWSTWLFWQYAADGIAPGVSGPVDSDRFGGSLTQLQALTAAAPAGTPLTQARPGCGGAACAWPICALLAVVAKPGRRRPR
jgi:lysozyme